MCNNCGGMLSVLAYISLRSHTIITLFRVMLRGPHLTVNYIKMTTKIHCNNFTYFLSLQYMFQGCASIRLSAVNIPLCSLGGWIFVTTLHVTNYVCEQLTDQCNLNYGKNDKTSLYPTKSYAIIQYPRRKGESLVWRQRPSTHIQDVTGGMCQTSGGCSLY